MSLHLHPHKLSPAYVSDWSERRLEDADELERMFGESMREIRSARERLRAIKHRAEFCGFEKIAEAAGEAVEAFEDFGRDRLDPIASVIKDEMEELG